jgi:hypothetical protein
VEKEFEPQGVMNFFTSFWLILLKAHNMLGSSTYNSSEISVVPFFR